jgi:tellurite resistance protein TerC
LWLWIVAVAALVVMLLVDLVAHRGDRVVSVREAVGWSAVWIALGLAFGGLVWFVLGGEAAGQYYAGYLIEKSLAVDNVFVFALIFSAFAVPREYQHRVLFFGVLGALVMRAGMIAGGAVLIERFSWVLYLFGAFLVFTGVQMARHRNRQPDPTRSPVLAATRKVVPSTTDWDGHKFWTRRSGRLLATPLFAVLVMIEVSDAVFAVDSIPAIFAVTRAPFLVFTSNVFAILGLRAMYFVLADLMHRFTYLKLGLAAVLVLVGVKMLLLEIYKIPTWLSLVAIAALIGGSVVASLRHTGDRPSTSERPTSERPALPTPTGGQS